ncbi:protein PLANT CADMIUM RESISTANCE 3 [Eurytemora carolleeae]|uniref:protein PLANT CADMIUM RESISTANCE 3 n=1 Tax=Eurytemora carolleeae TaxID=1294199 RepID=UPI000C76DC4D|nr:protein PLANT CADMIUM RESISTANCE 3 [Eurytemora carolleeae]|eukprot:XP_023344835.1 protein PLANT CADMIUM RESISTANCE 3-like [Eurytemora affinis]
MGGEWKHGTFDCSHDMGNCCMGWCCPCVQIYTNAEKLDESGILCCLLSCIAPCIPIFMLRNKAREMNGIEGSTVEDAFLSCCCGCCVSVQTANEVQ